MKSCSAVKRNNWEEWRASDGRREGRERGQGVRATAQVPLQQPPGEDAAGVATARDTVLPCHRPSLATGSSL